MAVAKFTWKNYGVSFNDLKYNTLPEQFFDYEESMLIANDYEYAIHKDSEPKKQT